MKDIEQLFREAFERYADELFRHAAIRLLERERAIELTQECFLRTLAYAKRGEEIREMRPFLFRTLRNLIIDEYRKTKSFSLDEMTENDEGEEFGSLMRDKSDPLEEAMGRFDGSRALKMIQKLPDLYREVIAMRYIDDFPIGEIASCIGESENVVSVRLHRGIKKLRALLESE